MRLNYIHYHMNNLHLLLTKPYIRFLSINRNCIMQLIFIHFIILSNLQNIEVTFSINSVYIGIVLCKVRQYGSFNALLAYIMIFTVVNIYGNSCLNLCNVTLLASGTLFNDLIRVFLFCRIFICIEDC